MRTLVGYGNTACTALSAGAANPEAATAAVKSAVSLDDAQKAITEYLASPGTDKMAAGKRLFAGLFEQLNAERSSVMGGLERVTRKQREAADKIRRDTLALQALQDATPPDQPKIDELGNQLVWETRIFEDRRRVVKFVCDVPTTIDQRLFALGRTLQQEME